MVYKLVDTNSLLVPITPLKSVISAFRDHCLRTSEDPALKEVRWQTTWRPDGTDHQSYFSDTLTMAPRLICGRLVASWVNSVMVSLSSQAIQKWTNCILSRRYLALWRKNNKRVSTKIHASLVWSSLKSSNRKLLRNVIWLVFPRKHFNWWLAYLKWIHQRDWQVNKLFDTPTSTILENLKSRKSSPVWLHLYKGLSTHHSLESLRMGQNLVQPTCQDSLFSQELD